MPDEKKKLQIEQIRTLVALRRMHLQRNETSGGNVNGWKLLVRSAERELQRLENENAQHSEDSTGHSV